MSKRIGDCNFNIDLEEQFLSDAILDLQQGQTTYIYKQKILDKLKQIFNDLEITKEEFYWKVRNIEVERLKPKRGRPRKIE